MPTIAIADVIAGSEVLVVPRARARRPSRVGGVAFGGDFEPWGRSSELGSGGVAKSEQQHCTFASVITDM